MSTASEHCRTVLAGVIPDRRDLLDIALAHLCVDHFPDLTLRGMFGMIERFAQRTNGILTRSAVLDFVRAARVDAGQAALYLETYDLLASRDVSEVDFRWSVDQVRSMAAERKTAVALTQAMEILNRGITDEKGQELQGHVDARTHLLRKFADIDRDLAMQDAPEGDMRIEGPDMLADYAESEKARKDQRNLGINFGIPTLDGKLGGLQRGDLVLAVGYTSEGKTSLVAQLAWNAAIRQGRNVVFLTTETLRAQVRRRIIARHSCLEHFDIRGGLNSRAIKNGSLDELGKRQLAMVVDDFTKNPGYGHLYIAQVPRSATIGSIESKLVRLQTQFQVDLVIMDYLALLKPERRRNSDREELANLLRESKQLATTFADGLGVPFASPWQVSRAARQEAAQNQCYQSSALSETSEASNSPDVIVSLLAPMDNDQRTATIRMQIMKHRDGERANPFDVVVDYATSRFIDQGSPNRVGSSSALDDLAGGL
jgi:replicative DNA helicase